MLTVLVAGCSPAQPPIASVPAPVSNVAASDTLPPNGWLLRGAAPQLYVTGTDRAVKHSGTGAAYIKARSTSTDEQSWATLLQSVKADEFRGKRVRLSGHVKTEGVRAQLWLRIDGASDALGMDNMDERPITGTTDWSRYDIVMDVPAAAAGIAFGLMVGGGGTAWLDDVTLEVVSDATASTAETRTDGAAEGPFKERYAARPARPINTDFENR